MLLNKEYIDFFQKLFNDNRDLVVELYNERTDVDNPDGLPHWVGELTIKNETTQISFLELPGISKSTINNHVIVVIYYYNQVDGTRIKSSFPIPVYDGFLQKLIREEQLSKLIND